MDILDKAKRYIDLFGRGMLREMAPSVAGGIFAELIRAWNIDVVGITKLIQEKRSLWQGVKPEHRDKIGSLLQRIGNLDFITPQMLISSIKGDFPAIASLFLGWPEAYTWLEEQVEEIKGAAVT